MFLCYSCNQEKEDPEFSLLIIGEWGKGIKRFCKTCRSPRGFIPDVYFDGKPEQGLANDPNTGEPMVFFSKVGKNTYMKDRGIMEAGDRVHGAPIEAHKNQEIKIDSKHEVQMALKKVKEMGRDVRRQEYLKIIKQGGRYAQR